MTDEDELASLRAEVTWLRALVDRLTGAGPPVAGNGSRIREATPERVPEARTTPRQPKGRRVRGGCSVPGCENPHRAQGYCARHYQMMKRGTLGESDRE